MLKIMRETSALADMDSKPLYYFSKTNAKGIVKTTKSYYRKWNEGQIDSSWFEMFFVVMACIV